MQATLQPRQQLSGGSASMRAAASSIASGSLIQAHADPGDGGGVMIGQLEARADFLRTLQEQGDGFHLRRGGGISRALGSGRASGGTR